MGDLGVHLQCLSRDYNGSPDPTCPSSHCQEGEIEEGRLQDLIQTAGFGVFFATEWAEALSLVDLSSCKCSSQSKVFSVGESLLPRSHYRPMDSVECVAPALF